MLNFKIASRGFEIPSLSKRELVVIAVVEDVHEVSVEWVHVFDLGELCEDSAKLLGKVGLREFDLAHVKSADPRYLELFVDLRGVMNMMEFVIVLQLLSMQM